jgi:hypothetical protein
VAGVVSSFEREWTWPDAQANSKICPNVLQARTFFDIPSEFIARSYAYSHLNHDDDFLRRVYPSMSRAFHCLENEIPEGHHLPTAAQMGRLEGSPSDPESATTCGFLAVAALLPAMGSRSGCADSSFFRHRRGPRRRSVNSLASVAQQPGNNPSRRSRLSGQVTFSFNC